MKWLIILAVFFIAIFQSTVSKYFEIAGALPNLLLVFGALCILLFDFDEIWPSLIFSGLALDFFSHFYFGTSLAALIVTAGIFNLFAKNFFNPKNILAGIILGLGALISYYFCLLGANELARVLGLAPDFRAGYFIRPFLAAIIYDFLIFSLVFVLARQLNRSHAY